jgi:hypothetical protein
MSIELADDSVILSRINSQRAVDTKLIKMPRAQKPGLPAPNSIGLRFDPSEVVQPYFINRFNVVREEGVFRVNVGCQVGGQLLKAAAVILPEETIFLNRSETVEYFNKMADITPAEPVQFMFASIDVFFGQMFGFARNGALGEMNPIFFRLHLLASEGKDVRASVGVSINMPIAVQLGIVKAIYLDQ